MLRELFFAVGILLIWYRLYTVTRAPKPTMPPRWELDPNSYRDDTGTAA